MALQVTSSNTRGMAGRRQTALAAPNEPKIHSAAKKNPLIKTNNDEGKSGALATLARIPASPGDVVEWGSKIKTENGMWANMYGIPLDDNGESMWGQGASIRAAKGDDAYIKPEDGLSSQSIRYRVKNGETGVVAYLNKPNWNDGRSTGKATMRDFYILLNGEPIVDNRPNNGGATQAGISNNMYYLGGGLLVLGGLWYLNK